MTARVSVVSEPGAAYLTEPPYHPDTAWPEWSGREVSASPNPAYRMVRQALADLGLDRARFGTAQWNPLGDIVRPGETVVIKPNFVISRNRRAHTLDSIVTHPSVLRAIADYVYLALGGRGRIVIADTPQMDCNWDDLMAYQRLGPVIEYYRRVLDFELELYDLRRFEVIDPEQAAYSTNRKPLAGDPLGTVKVDLGARSAFTGLTGEELMYGADYDRRETIALHSGGRHEYHLAATVLAADTVISVPKMKVHKKVGVTLNLKGLVGTVSNKNCLVHYRLGTPKHGGDQLPDSANVAGDLKVVRIQRWLMDRTLAHQSGLGDWLYRFALGAYRRLIKPWRPVSTSTLLQDDGNWSGNDSCWRMTADLARIFYFASAKGELMTTRQRKTFCIVDGVTGGEKEGPLSASPVASGCIVAGENPFAVDMVTTRLMGFDVGKVKQFGTALSGPAEFGIGSTGDIEPVVNGAPVAAAEFFAAPWHSPVPAFAPHPGWVGTIELK
jgi:uncharacterized protein (DUF362 family)